MLLFSSAYNEYTVISKEYTGPLYFDITGVYCIYIVSILLSVNGYKRCLKLLLDYCI